jgi:hypothetical protein
LQTKTREKKLLPDGLSSTAEQQAHPLPDANANHGPHLRRQKFHFITGNYLLCHLAHPFSGKNTEKDRGICPTAKKRGNQSGRIGRSKGVPCQRTINLLEFF